MLLFTIIFQFSIALAIKEHYQPKTINDILKLSPKQLKEQLDFSGQEVNVLKQNLTKIDILS